ncbi:hypothetical protein [Chitinophaga deserti]|uniref:hypothetical protein n=1 Tax=Chitinophaga deserti TaxID=2164099 RepID=UPI000D6C5680|nr:hypothetical protein [Chitinophaga deserti]
MTEAIFGIIGVLIGSFVPWFQTYWLEKRATRKSARYLAIRIVCVLDEYLEKCGDVVYDNGLSYGQRNADGCLEAQVKSPGAPVYPEDVDWKSIDHELMYRILSLPSEVEAAERLISSTHEISDPPDFKVWFDERAYWYCSFGLTAYKLVGDICDKYEIKKKTYNNWNPHEDLVNRLNVVNARRQKRMEGDAKFVESFLGTSGNT